MSATPAARHRVHITGASGCGVTTLGRALAAALGGLALDTDDFYWIATNPPFRQKRTPDERIRLLRQSLPEDRTWILSGAIGNWGEPLVPLFDLVVFLEAPTGLRIARLRERERERFGAAALETGGFFHRNHEEFIAWAAQYESGELPGRSRLVHEKWLASLPCPVLRLISDRPPRELVAEAVAVISPKRVVIEDYNAEWPAWFETIRAELWPVVSDFALSIEPVGSTAIPGLAAKPVIDIDIVILSVGMRPLAVDRLASLGYVHQGDPGIPGREAFRKAGAGRKHHLYVCLANSPALVNHFAVRKHLRLNPESAMSYGALKRRLAAEFGEDREGYTNSKSDFIRSILFEAPLQLNRIMVDFSFPWFVAGGWALDLYMETLTREHSDIELLIFRENQLALQEYLMRAGFTLTKIIPASHGGTEASWLAGEVLEARVHQMRARSAAFGFDIFIADCEAAGCGGDNDWVYRRDRRITRARTGIGGTSGLGIPFLAPEIVLLFKAKYLLLKDLQDFECVHPHLGENARRWLKSALALAHPGCPWLGVA